MTRDDIEKAARAGKLLNRAREEFGENSPQYAAALENFRPYEEQGRGNQTQEAEAPPPDGKFSLDCEKTKDGGFLCTVKNFFSKGL